MAYYITGSFPQGASVPFVTVSALERKDLPAYTMMTWFCPRQIPNSAYGVMIMRERSDRTLGGSQVHNLGRAGFFNGNAKNVFWAEHTLDDDNYPLGSLIITSSTVPVKDVWYHLTFVYQSGSYAKLYVNGIMENVTSSTYNTQSITTKDIGIGTYPEATSVGLTVNADMCDTAMWKVALDESSIQKIAWCRERRMVEQVQPEELLFHIPMDDVPQSRAAPSVPHRYFRSGSVSVSMFGLKGQSDPIGYQ